MTWDDLLSETVEQLVAFGVGNPTFEAAQMMASVSGYPASQFAEIAEAPVTQRAVAKLDAMMKRRSNGEPLQYVLGEWSFRHIDLMVDERVLIPRPETEMLVEVSLAAVAELKSPKVLDLGCGSGAIGLSIAYERGDAEVTMTDISPDALAVASANLAGLGMAGSNVEIRQGEWFAALREETRHTFDLIVSNPPYVGATDELEDSVLEWEPHAALFAENKGLADLELILGQAPLWLSSQGILTLEMAPWQVEHLLAKARDNFDSVESFVDLAGNDRGIVCRVSSE